MEQYIPARAVIDKIRIIKTFFLWLLPFGGLFCFFRGEQLFIYSIAAWIASYMIIEDYEEKTVDLRLCLSLLAVLTLDSFGWQFILNLFLGYIFFEIYYLLLCKKHPMVIGQIEHYSSVELGFLPSLALSIFIWTLVKRIFSIQDFFLPYDLIDFIFWVLLGVVIWSYLYFRIKKFEKLKNVVIQEGLGKGDVFVCAIGFAFFGAEDFLISLFMALWIQLIFYKIIKFKNRM